MLLVRLATFTGVKVIASSAAHLAPVAAHHYAEGLRTTRDESATGVKCCRSVPSERTS